MTLFTALLLGILQGMTEFIPVSSTAHLLIGHALLGIPADESTFAFLVLVQLGTLGSLLAYFWKDLLGLGRAFFARPFSTPENALAWHIVLASLPALLAGVLLKHWVEALFRAPLVEAAVRLFAAAVLMLAAEWLGKQARRLDAMRGWDALVIGLFQVLAVFPGASRSGTTISAGMLRGFDRPSAARFAFLMSVPIMLAAGAYEALDLLKMSNLAVFLPFLVVGFVVAAVVGWLAIKWLLGYLNQHSLYLFAIYCAAVGLVALTIQAIL